MESTDPAGSQTQRIRVKGAAQARALVYVLDDQPHHIRLRLGVRAIKCRHQLPGALQSVVDGGLTPHSAAVAVAVPCASDSILAKQAELRVVVAPATNDLTRKAPMSDWGSLENADFLAGKGGSSQDTCQTGRERS
jgi:hypothetical protein